MMKKFLALLTVLVLALGIVATPNTSAQAAETSGEVTFLNGNLYNQAGEITILANAYAPDVNWLSTAADAFGWYAAMLIEYDPATEIWTVTQSHTPQQGVNTILQTGKVGKDEATGVITAAIFFHANAGDDPAKKASFDFFTENNEVGKQFKVEGDFMSKVVNEDYSAKEGAISGLTFKLVEKNASGTTDTGATDNKTEGNAGSSNAGSNVPSTGDAAPVVAMASMLFVAVACVALGLKKRNA